MHRFRKTAIGGQRVGIGKPRPRGTRLGLADAFLDLPGAALAADIAVQYGTPVPRAPPNAVPPPAGG